jgi:muramidase (phage lysozyme)
MANEKVETLRQRKARLEAQIAAIEAAEKARQRKEDTRLKVLVGAGILADIAKHPETRGAIETVLRRAIIADRDRLFLKSKGWI